MIDDPTLYVLEKMGEVLDELRVSVETFRLMDLKNNITTLPQTLKEDICSSSWTPAGCMGTRKRSVRFICVRS